MNLKEYAQYDALGLGELVRKGEVIAKELAELALSGVEKVNPDLNAVIEVYRDRIDDLDESDIADGPFKGVPFFLKDLNVLEKGRKCEMGSRLTKGFVAPHDSDIVVKFREAGLNNLGRTTCPEVGFTLTTVSVATGVTRNPWNLEKSCGGSSGGSAAIVAAGAVPMAHANDGGGSTRIPASMNGLVGLKCSRGRVPYGPDYNDLQLPYFSELVVSRSVRDTAALLDAVAGPTPGAATMYQFPERPFLEEVGHPTGKLRIALAAGDWGGHKPAPDVTAEIERMGKLLESMGHEVVDTQPDIDFNEFVEVFQTLYCTFAPPFLELASEMMGRPISEETLEPVVLKAYEYAKANIGVKEHMGILQYNNIVSRQLGLFLTEYDLLLTPTMAQPVHEVGTFRLDDPEMELSEWFDEVLETCRYTPLNNFTGTPAISVPLCRTADDMPLGAHFIAPMGGEAVLIRLAAALEEAAPWAGRIPQVHVSR
jgi:amidase